MDSLTLTFVNPLNENGSIDSETTQKYSVPLSQLHCTKAAANQIGDFSKLVIYNCHLKDFDIKALPEEAVSRLR